MTYQKQWQNIILKNAQMKYEFDNWKNWWEERFIDLLAYFDLLKTFINEIFLTKINY